MYLKKKGSAVFILLYVTQFSCTVKQFSDFVLKSNPVKSGLGPHNAFLINCSCNGFGMKYFYFKSNFQLFFIFYTNLYMRCIYFPVKSKSKTRNLYLYILLCTILEVHLFFLLVQY
uniref:Uncharacterized protein n=1 Tax=Micrurus spixii TaxID=129469 RepID=A0A2D4MFE7_9SAUR